MIRVEIKPRQDDLYDMYVGDEGDHFVNSSQGYANVEDCVAIARRLWPPLPAVEAPIHSSTGVTISDDELQVVRRVLTSLTERVVLRVTYRNGKTHTEQLR